MQVVLVNYEGKHATIRHILQTGNVIFIFLDINNYSVQVAVLSDFVSILIRWALVGSYRLVITVLVDKLLS